MVWAAVRVLSACCVSGLLALKRVDDQRAWENKATIRHFLTELLQAPSQRRGGGGPWADSGEKSQVMEAPVASCFLPYCI